MSRPTNEGGHQSRVESFVMDSVASLSLEVWVSSSSDEGPRRVRPGLYKGESGTSLVIRRRDTLGREPNTLRRVWFPGLAFFESQTFS